MIDRNDPYFWADLLDTILKGAGETFYTVGLSLLFTVIFGLATGVLLVTTESGGLLSKLFGSRALGFFVNRVLDAVVNIGRSIPFIILMILLIPFTRLLVGSFIGPTAAIVPLTIAGIPFFARLVEIGIREVPVGLVEAAQSLGATRWTILTKVMVAEAVPALALGLSTTVVTPPPPGCRRPARDGRFPAVPAPWPASPRASSGNCSPDDRRERTARHPSTRRPLARESAR